MLWASKRSMAHRARGGGAQLPDLGSGQCPLWVISGHRSTFEQCPLYPRKRTSVEPVGMSAKCQKRTRHRARNRCLLLHRAAAFGPVLEAAEVVNALIAHVFENLAAER